MREGGTVRCEISFKLRPLFQCLVVAAHRLLLVSPRISNPWTEQVRIGFERQQEILGGAGAVQACS